MTNEPGGEATTPNVFSANTDTDLVAEPSASLAAELAALGAMDGAALRERWRAVTGLAPPRVRTPLLRMALAWELQAGARGGLSRAVRRELAMAAHGKGGAVKVAPGSKLVREWKGVLHTVSVGEDGSIVWDGKQWTSLSAAARAITGSRWSGPVFFGLTQAQAAS